MYGCYLNKKNKERIKTITIDPVYRVNNDIIFYMIYYFTILKAWLLCRGNQFFEFEEPTVGNLSVPTQTDIYFPF